MKLTELLTAPEPSAALTILPSSVTVEIVGRTASAAVGDEVSEVTVTVRGQGKAAGFDEMPVTGEGNRLLADKLASGERLLGSEPTFSYQIRESAVEAQTATLDVVATAEKVPTADHAMFDRRQLVKKTREQIETYFATFPNIQNTTVVLSPFWSRTSPSLPNRIAVKIAVGQDQ